MRQNKSSHSTHTSRRHLLSPYVCAVRRAPMLWLLPIDVPKQHRARPLRGHRLASREARQQVHTRAGASPPHLFASLQSGTSAANAAARPTSTAVAAPPTPPSPPPPSPLPSPPPPIPQPPPLPPPPPSHPPLLPPPPPLPPPLPPPPYAPPPSHTVAISLFTFSGLSAALSILLLLLSRKRSSSKQLGVPEPPTAADDLEVYDPNELTADEEQGGSGRHGTI